MVEIHELTAVVFVSNLEIESQAHMYMEATSHMLDS